MGARTKQHIIHDGPLGGPQISDLGECDALAEQKEPHGVDSTGPNTTLSWSLLGMIRSIILVGDIRLRRWTLDQT
jgi:hypothetical protein